MRLKKPLLAQLLLLVGLLGAFQFGSYYSTLHFEEVARACVFALFGWLALSTKTKKEGLWIILLPPVGIALLVLLYACVFSLRTGAPVIPSILAGRDYAFFLIAPIVYTLHVRGWQLADFTRIFVFAASLVVIDYAVAHFTIDLKSWANSMDLHKQSLVTYDDWRGYKLKGPRSIVLFVVLYSGRRILQVKGLLSFLFRSALFALAVVLLALEIPRTLLACMLLALILYRLFLFRAKYVGLLLVLTPMFVALTALIIPYVLDASATIFGSDASYFIRVESAEQAWRSFLKYPLLGFGQDSQRTIPFQTFFGPLFWPSDIGLLGIAFQYGLVGVLLSLYFVLWIVANLLKLLWVYNRDVGPRQLSFLWALFITCLVFLIATPLQPGLIFSEGLAVGAFSWGLLLAHKHGLSGGLSSD